MTHPMTDEMCKKIQLRDIFQTHGDWMRAAADWQLEQVIGWLEKYEAVGLERDNFVVCLTYELKRAMRPQQQQSPSLKERALESLAAIENMSDQYVQFNQDIDIIRRALTSIPQQQEDN